MGGGDLRRIDTMRIRTCQASRLTFFGTHAFANTTPQVDQTFTAGVSAKSFKLSVLAINHPSYTSLKEQFLSKWLKNADGLTVERIIKVEVRTA